MLEINSVYQVSIEENNIFSNGICHIDGQVVFVKGAVAEDLCKIKITGVQPRFAYAEVTEIISPSKKRVEPSCSAFGTCGGCCFLNIDIENELEIKKDYLKNTFKRHSIDIEIENIVSPVNKKYRNKVVYFFESGQYGYMASGTNTLVPHNHCILNEDIFDEIASFTKKELKDTSIRALYIRKTSHQSPEIMVCPIFYQSTDIIKYATKLVSTFKEVKTVLYSVYDKKDFALENVRFKTIYGDGYITDELLGLKFRISPSSFYQVNHACASLLYEKAIELANLNSETTCADLFCGTGTIGILCAKKTGAAIYGVEINEDAIRDAKFNAKLNGVKSISFEATDAKNFKKSVDVSIIDPPRKGCSPFMIETILRIKPKRIVYVSCNADTLARDLKSLLCEYDIASPLYTFNMFPRTSHVESVVCLSRKQ